MHKNDCLLFLPNKSISMAVNVTFIDLKSSFTCRVEKSATVKKVHHYSTLDWYRYDLKAYLRQKVVELLYGC